ncbi:hypothetical protein H1V43_04300 [Streptomyces sp. PSKA54]|uniref:Uncharacterized protein n=1 Tax=Streptomyces himalayensis subsp. aureolus TaxID=2758039 RepID=A0A7W2HE99_9ACTN|nr:hypothetical protein [Streptomyces himalayensis]MBA4860610.1 hypothetical protein [Streptomyces himalayensis subsp. aureolus]
MDRKPALGAEHALAGTGLGRLQTVRYAHIRQFHEEVHRAFLAPAAVRS